MGLVSALYRMVPSEGPASKAESDRRVAYKLRRLVATHGEAEVIRRLRGATVPKEYEAMRSRLILQAIFTEAA